MGLEDRVIQQLEHKKKWNLLEMAEVIQADPLEVYGVLRRLEKLGRIRFLVGGTGKGHDHQPGNS
jgi:predicted transcriptional regulator